MVDDLKQHAEENGKASGTSANNGDATIIEFAEHSATVPQSALEAHEPSFGGGKGWTVFVDGANQGFDSRRQADVDRLVKFVDELRGWFHGATIQVLVDPAYLGHLSGAQEQRYKRLLEEPEFAQTPSSGTHMGQSADRYLLRLARQTEKAIVVSNDRFRNGDEVELRVDVPLLKVAFTDSHFMPDDCVEIYQSADDNSPRRVPLMDLLNAG